MSYIWDKVSKYEFQHAEGCKFREEIEQSTSLSLAYGGGGIEGSDVLDNPITLRFCPYCGFDINVETITMYDYFDATNAAIEICRKGMFKYTKGLFYPDITGTISDTMSRLVEEQNIQLNSRDVQMVKDCRKWSELHKIAKNNGLRWRWGFEDIEKHFTTFSMNSKKSKVQIIRFHDYV